jgi:hypothetical protein
MSVHAAYEAFLAIDKGVIRRKRVCLGQLNGQNKYRGDSEIAEHKK